MTTDEPPVESAPQSPRRLSPLTKALAAAGVLVVLAAIGLGLWSWTRPDKPNYAADCGVLQDEAPAFGRDLVQLEHAMGNFNLTPDSIRHAGNHLHDVGVQMTDKKLGQALVDGGKSELDAAAAIEHHDTNALVRTMPQEVALIQTLYNWLAEHCPAWKGPGRWDPRGTTSSRTAPIPTMPSFPMPSLPSLPSMPGLPGGTG